MVVRVEKSSAVSGPLWALHLCDNECSEQGFKHFQLAAVVLEEGGAVRTLNLCNKQCHNERRVQQRQTACKGSTVKRNDGTETISWQAVEGIWEWNSFCAGSVSILLSKRPWAKAVLADTEKQAGRHTREVAIRTALQRSTGAESGRQRH